MYAKYLELSAGALLATVLSLYVLDWLTKNNRKRMFILSIVLFVIYLYVPVYQNASLAMLLRGFYSDLSITFICLIIVAYINKVIYVRRKLFLPRRLALITFSSGLILYLSAFGVIKYDIYSHGYILNNYMLLVIFCLCMMIYQLHKKYAWVMLISLCAYYFEILPSNNIFDYFLDIPLVLVSLFSLCQVNKTQIKNI